MTSSSAIRILKLAQQSIIGPADFQVFGLGGVIRTLEEEPFNRWVEYLLSKDTTVAAYVLLDLYHSFYVFRSTKELPAELTYKVLTHPGLLQPKTAYSPMVDHNWSQIGLHLVKEHPDKAVPLAIFVLEHLGEDGTIFDGYDTEPEQVADLIAREHPVEIWQMAAKDLGPPIDKRAYKMKGWVQGNLIHIPQELIWKWVEEDVNKRAWYLATFVPKSLSKEPSITRELLVRYGDREDVRTNLIASFQTGGWAGSNVAHYQQKRDALVTSRKSEENENVRRWLDEYIDQL